MDFLNYKIPLNWQIKPFKDACQFSKKPRGLIAKGKIPFFPMEIISENGIYARTSIYKNSGEIGSGTFVNNGDVVVAKITPSFENGKQAIIDIEEPYAYATTEVIPFDELADISNKLFLFYVLKHPAIRSTLAGKMEGSTGRQRLSKDVLGNYKIPFPPLEEQRKIAGVLSLVQDVIAQQEQLITLTTELKKALIQKLFTEGTRGELQKMTEIGLIPESWDVIPLGNMFQIKHGYAFDGEYFKPEGEFILMTPGHFYEDGGFRDQKDKTKYYTGKIPDGYLLNEGDLLVAMTEQKSGLLGSSAFVPESNKYLHNQRLGLIEKLDELYLYKQFLFHIFNTPHIRSEIARTATGSKVKHTSPSKIRDVLFGLPDIKEQIEIAFLLDKITTKIDTFVSKKKMFSELFTTLLHQLMTAQIRVDDLNLSTLNVELQGGNE